VIERLIRWSVGNRGIVLLLAAMLAGWGVWAVRNTPVDAIPDLSDIQVIIKTTYPGQAPQVVEDQITYPLSTALLAVPGATTVRGVSMFGDSYVYVLFREGTDLYWARSRVLEYLSQVAPRLPPGARPALGPDATGVGWIFQYALIDRTGRHDVGQLRALQDWFLKFELQATPGVAEVAPIGGMVRQYQVVVDPNALRAYGLPLAQVREAIERANQESGGSVLEMAEAEYMVRASGYVKGVDDLRNVPLKANPAGVPVLLKDVADIRLGPELRRSVGELDGQGEAVGGVVVMRWGENALTTIDAIKAKVERLRASLPEGVEIVTTYDRSGLIGRAIDNLTDKLAEESVFVVLVCAAFLLHLRSSLVIILTLPLGILAAFVVMHAQGINANIMSLGGIAIAIGAMVDAAIVMIESLHRRIEHEPLTGENRWRLVAETAAEVGPALFFSLVIITLSFLPVFALEAQEGRMFKPLAFTKTYAMAAASVLSVTLVPVLMGYFVRGRIVPERRNPLNTLLIWLYRPVLRGALAAPWLTILAAVLLVASMAWPLQRIGSEFMPDLDEGDLLYMPSLMPDVSLGKAREVLQQTDRLIRTVPEVEAVYGKIGRAETATDPAPISMFETTIKLKPREAWRPGMTMAGIRAELDRAVKVPGVTNVWIMPIKNRIDMLATGVKTPVGIKVAGPDLGGIGRIAAQVEAAVRTVPGTASAYAERPVGGRYVDVDIDRRAAARYGLNIADVQEIVAGAIGGETIGETVEGVARYPISVRYPRELRDSLEGVRSLPILTPTGQQITLSTVARVEVADGPPMLKTENARPSTWVYVDVRSRDLSSVVTDLRRAVAEEVKLPPGVSIAYSGQFEYLQRATERLKLVVPATLAIIFLLLYLTFRRLDEAALIMGTVPFALTGGIWALYLLGYNQSIATGVGFIALAGVAAEFGVVMLIYLKHALAERGAYPSREALEAAVREGALLRVRPKAMTVAVILAGLAPILIGHGAGSEVMSRIAAPMIGGMLTAPLLSMLVIPAGYLLIRRRWPDRPPSTASTQGEAP
jgi:Cu(I)/Ag(I) efflux system membrane protein CusA/SilA